MDSHCSQHCGNRIAVVIISVLYPGNSSVWFDTAQVLFSLLQVPVHESKQCRTYMKTAALKRTILHSLHRILLKIGLSVRSSFLSQPLITFILSTASRMLWLWRMQCKTSTSGSWFQDSAERIISARRWSPQPWRRWQGDSASRDQWCCLRNWSKGQFAGNHGLYPHLYVYIQIYIYIYSMYIRIYIYIYRPIQFVLVNPEFIHPRWAVREGNSKRVK